MPMVSFSIEDLTLAQPNKCARCVDMIPYNEVIGLSCGNRLSLVLWLIGHVCNVSEYRHISLFFVLC